MLLLSRNAVLSLIGLSLILHSAEEYLTFPSFLASIGTRLPAWFPAAKLHASQVLPFALLLAPVLPLLVSVSLVYAATRHEHMGPILQHAWRFFVQVGIFLTIVFAVLLVMSANL